MGHMNEWDDTPLPEDAAIDAAHPSRTGQHEIWDEAMRFVGARRSKGALVGLVNWLLATLAREREKVKALEATYPGTIVRMLTAEREAHKEAAVLMRADLDVAHKAQLDLMAQVVVMRTALSFAACTIKSGEPWTPRCEEMIGGALTTSGKLAGTKVGEACALYLAGKTSAIDLNSALHAAGVPTPVLRMISMLHDKR